MTILRLTLALLIALSLAACASATDPSPPPPASADPGPAIDTDTLIADPSRDGQLVRVSGFFLATDDTAVLCSLTLESYPPQCGGATVRVTGEVPADVLDALDSTDDPTLAQATWGQVVVTGTYQASGADGQPTIELTSIALDNLGG